MVILNYLSCSGFIHSRSEGTGMKIGFGRLGNEINYSSPDNQVKWRCDNSIIWIPWIQVEYKSLRIARSRACLTTSLRVWMPASTHSCRNLDGFYQFSKFLSVYTSFEGRKLHHWYEQDERKDETMTSLREQTQSIKYRSSLIKIT